MINEKLKTATVKSLAEVIADLDKVMRMEEEGPLSMIESKKVCSLASFKLKLAIQLIEQVEK
jgi:RNA polymerase-interacting CarD/CdnL/TRCF family regulator